jgi:hypothetical protein
MIESTGGSYLDEAQNTTKDAATLTAIADLSEAATAPVTPLSTLVKERALALVSNEGKSIEEATSLSNSYVASLFGLEVEDLVALPASPTSGINLDPSANRSALALAAFSFFMKDFSHNGSEVSAEAALTALANDLKDNGTLDASYSNPLTTSLALEWATLMGAARTLALADDNLIFKSFDDSFKTQLSSAVFETGESNFDSNYEDENQITFTGVIPSGFTYVGSKNIVFETGAEFPEGASINTSGWIEVAGTDVAIRGSLTASEVNFNGPGSRNSGLITAGSVTFLGGEGAGGDYAFNEGTIVATQVGFGEFGTSNGPTGIINATTVDFWGHTTCNSGTINATTVTFSGTSSFNNANFSYGHITADNVNFSGPHSALQGNTNHIQGTITFSNGYHGDNFYWNNQDIGDYDSSLERVTFSVSPPSDFDWNGDFRDFLFTNLHFPVGAEISTTGQVIFNGTVGDTTYNLGTINAHGVFSGSAYNEGYVQTCTIDSNYNHGTCGG